MDERKTAARSPNSSLPLPACPRCGEVLINNLAHTCRDIVISDWLTREGEQLRICGYAPAILVYNFRAYVVDNKKE